MLPTTSGSSPAGQRRQHRRQNSTPSAAHNTGERFAPYPSSQQRRQALSHRRGMSLDLRQLQTADATTNTNHNAGLAAIPQHHVLREAQQHSPQARPGPGSQATFSNTNKNSSHGNSHNFINNNNNSNNTTKHQIAEGSYLVSPHGTPQPHFDPSYYDPSTSFDSFTEANANAILHNSQLNLGAGVVDNQSFQLFDQSSALSAQMLTYNDLSATQDWSPQPQSDNNAGNASSQKPSGRRISGGIAEQVSKYERMGLEAGPRASTPPIQAYNAYMPLTPTDTPSDRAAKQEARLDRFSEEYDGSMEETIKPKRNNNARNLSVFADSLHHAGMQSAGPSPPASSTFPNPGTFPGAQLDTSFGQHMPNTPHRTQFSAPFGSSPGSVHNVSYSAHGTPHSAQLTPTAQSNAGSQPSSPSMRPRKFPHRRSDSMASAASVASAASISNINFDEAKTDTGVSIEEIARFISGPDLIDGRWTCTFDNCGKKFGRKENIKSHVQTHLNDRQYVCPTCRKCFVRQHDLKRHAKIHTGIKPYPCECGNSFARHDALTRHRQRGMCVGAFDGIVKKNVKRGRPRKPRPEMDERREKSTKTRRKNNMSMSSVSSQSGYTDSSAATTPGAQMDVFTDMNDMIDLAGGLQQYDNSASSSAPMPSVAAPAVVDAAPSPAATSPHSYVSPQALMEKTPLSLASPAHTEGSQYTSPAPPQPELPAARPSIETDQAFLSLDADNSISVEGLPNLTASSSIATSASLDDLLPPEYNTQEMRSYMSFTDLNDLSALDREPFKFEELFPDSGDMYDANAEADPFSDYGL